MYEFGRSITDVLSRSAKYDFRRAECSSLDDLKSAVAQYDPEAIIYNYMPSVLPWVATKLAPLCFSNNVASIRKPQIAIIHDVTQSVADTATACTRKLILRRGGRLTNSIFDFYIAPDPTLLLRNPLVYKTGRLLQAYQNTFPLPAVPTIGSFGFGTPNKGFDRIVRRVQEEFDEAILRFNIPAADFGDKHGASARAIAQTCQALITKPGIRLVVTNDFLDQSSLLDFAAQNTINVFLYGDTGNRGLSSAIDIAMSVQRPIAVSQSVMFRHLFDVTPSVCIENNSLRSMIQNGFAPLQKHYEEWSADNLLWEYERVLDSVLKHCGHHKSAHGLNRIWLRNRQEFVEDDMSVVSSPSYEPVPAPAAASANRILDDRARDLYKPASDKVTALVPNAVSRKIARANVQQAFVFDTVWRWLPQYQNPKILCIGCYEDTAAMSLKKMGIAIEEIDPVLNYTLQEYVTKPSVLKNSYDIIFSTSVIEHDPDDESFVRCVSELLAPGGVFIMTCDYKEGWVPGDPKPEVDARFYTKRDLTDRLPRFMAGCNLVDEPQWDCPNPDFKNDRYLYTFATFVVRKQASQGVPRQAVATSHTSAEAPGLGVLAAGIDQT
ncbi:MAG: class I SAM-dependent methyltransferase [Terriglobales bacterium]